MAHILGLACVLVAIGVGRLVGKKRQIGIADAVFDMALVAVPVGRAVFVIIWFSVYQEDPWSIFDIRDGGFELWSAVAAAIAVAAWRVRQQPSLMLPLVSGLLAGMGFWFLLPMAEITGAPPEQGMPALSLIALNGEPIPLAALAKGRAVVVNMWATWCPPCRREMPALAHAQRLHPEISFVFVNQGESLAVVQRYLLRQSFRLDHVLVDQGNLLGKFMHSSALPMTLIYSTHGQLTFSHQGLISEAVLAMQLDKCCSAQR